MDTIFMNSWNSKTVDPHRLLLNLSNKINLKRKNKYVALSNFSIYYTWENIKLIDLKYLLQHALKNLNYLMDHILYQILNISLKNMRHLLIILQNKNKAKYNKT